MTSGHWPTTPIILEPLKRCFSNEDEGWLGQHSLLTMLTIQARGHILHFLVGFPALHSSLLQLVQLVQWASKQKRMCAAKYVRFHSIMPQYWTLSPPYSSSMRPSVYNSTQLYGSVEHQCSQVNKVVLNYAALLLHSFAIVEASSLSREFCDRGVANYGTS